MQKYSNAGAQRAENHWFRWIAFSVERLTALLICGAFVSYGAAAPVQDSAADLENTRIVLEKWIETQRIISKERKDWQQGVEILQGRLELSKKEITSLEEKNRQAKAGIVEVNNKHDEFQAENDRLKAIGEQLTEAATHMEAEVRRIYKRLPEPIQAKLQPLYQRIPEDPSKSKASFAERFQNILGILNEINKANNEITVNYEVRMLSNGRPSEVKVLYVGMAQAYYVSASGEAGVGRPTDTGWIWESAGFTLARDVLAALEILQGTKTPVFVPLPVKLQ
jgi:hypothetical protein